MNAVPSRAAGTDAAIRPPLRTGRLLPAVALAVGALWGCSDSVVEVGSELSLSLDVPASAPVSDSLAVTYDVRGRSLLGMVLRYDDGRVDSVFFAGSQTAGGRLTHLYEEAGTYRILGEVTDAIEGTVTAEVSVTLTP